MFMSCRGITENIAWQLFEGEEKLRGMKTTRVNGITTNSGALTQVWEIK